MDINQQLNLLRMNIPQQLGQPPSQDHSKIGEHIDDDYLLVASHLDDTIRQKIVNHKYVDFAKLLCHEKSCLYEEQKNGNGEQGGHVLLGTHG